MLTPTVAQLIIEDRIREAEGYRTARTARPQRTRAAGAPRLRRSVRRLIHPRAGVTPP